MSFTLVIADSCTAANRSVRQNILLKCLLRRNVIKKQIKLSHSCVAEFKFCTLLYKQEIILNTKSFRYSILKRK